ncbi:hypothetical protein E2320_022810 [Naja naja]|nr:hypothetical protein E2320_022810 [Naja naja]
MMNEDDILLVEDTQQPSSEEKTKKLQKRSREEVKQPIVSSDQTSHSSQDTEDSGTSRKKHKKKKSSLETSDASQVISETQLSNESEINNFVPKKNKRKMKHRLKHGSDEEGWSPSTPNKSSQPSLKKALANAGGVDDDEFWSPSTPKTSSKLPQKEDLGNGSLVDGNRSSQKKKKRKQREVVYVPDGPAKEKADATSSQREVQMDLEQTIETRMMNEDDILLVKDTQQPSYEEKTKKLQKRSREEVKQPIGSSDQTSHSSQDTEDSGTSRKKHKKKKSSLETSDASRIISETQLSNESEINNFVPKKNKRKMKHRLKHGSDEEGWSPSTPNKSSQQSPEKALANAGVVDEDEFWSPSTPKTSSKLPQKEDLGNGSLVDGNRSSQKKKKRKQREVVYVPDGPAKEKAEATSSQRDQMDLDQTIETRMMNEDDILLVEDTQQPSSEEKTKKLQKRSREEVKQPIGSSDQTSHSSQDTEDSGTSRKKHKKKKSSLETSDASRVISETQLSNESEINNFVPKKNKRKMKHRLKHGSDEEGWSPPTPNKSSQPFPKKALTNAGVVDEDEFWSPSTPKTSSKLPQKEDLGNGSLVDGNRSSQKKKKRKQREVIYVPDGPAKEKAEATSSQRDQMDLDQTIETRMMNEDDILLVKDTQQPSSEEKTKKLQKRSREEAKQPIASSDQTSHSSQDTEDSGTSRKKHKKKSSLETSDASRIISETQLSNEPEINNFVPKKNKRKMKHRLKHGSDEEGWSPSTPNKSSQPSPKKALANAGGVDDDEFWSPSTPKTSSKLPQKEDLGNGSLVDGNRSSQKKKKRKQREVVYVPDGPAKEKAEATSSQRDQMDLDQTIETRMMNEDDILLVEDTQQPSSEEKTKKLQKRSREEAKQPNASSDQTSHSSQDTEDSGTSRKKHKKKKSSLETSDASQVISETQLSNESEINNFVPKKNKRKMKHRLKHGSDEEGWSPPTPNKSSQPFPKKALTNAGVVDEDEFWSPSTPKTSSKLPQKEDLGNGSLVDGNRSSQKKKKRKQREVVYVPDGPAKEKAEATSSQRDQMDLDQTIETRMMNEDDILLVKDTQQPSYEEKTKKLQKRSREEVKQPIASSDQTSHSSQDTEDSGTSRKKHKKKKSSLETSDASQVISETQLSNESKINNFVPKKNKRKMKHRLKHGSDEEGWSPSTPNKSSQQSPEKALANAGVVDEDEFWSPSTPKTSSKLPQKEDLGNGSLVDGNRSSQKKKKRKQREVVYVPDGPAKEKAEATSSQREVQMDLDQTIDMQMNLFDSSPLSFSGGPQVDRHPGHGQERSRSPTAEDSEATQVDLEMEGTSAGDHEQTQPRSPSKLPTLGLNTKLDRTGRKLRSSRKQSPSKTCSEEEEEDAYALDKKQMENARKELEEFIPRAKTLADSAIRQLARRDLARFRELKKKGLAVRFGVFSQAENNLLTENMEAFLEESGIESAEKLLFSNRFPEEKAEIKRLKCQYSFCERIAQGIARPWRLVYYRARKMFDPQNYKGRNVPPDYVQNRYYQLKASYVPFWYEKTFPEIIDYLFEETLPTLKETHKRLAQRHRAPQEDRSCKKSFHLTTFSRYAGT